MIRHKNIGAVILAAGSSSRLGHPKQLVDYNNKTLLQHAIDTIVPFNFTPSILVLGAHAKSILKATVTNNIEVVMNENWAEGISSSIRLGVSEAIKLNDSLDSILFLLSDQPYVSAELIQQLLKIHVNGDRSITACRYSESTGVPAIFSCDYFHQLLELRGDTGAKNIISQNMENVQTVKFNEGSVDVDTREDYWQLMKRLKIS